MPQPSHTQPPRQPWHTFPFWFLFLSGIGLTAAWKLDLLPGHDHPHEGVATLDEPSEIDFPEAPARVSAASRVKRTEEEWPAMPDDSLLAGQEEPVADASKPLPRIVPRGPQSKVAPSAPAASPTSPPRSFASAQPGNPFSTADAEFRSAAPSAPEVPAARDADTPLPWQTASLDDVPQPPTRSAVVPSAFVEGTGPESRRITQAAGEALEGSNGQPFDFTAIDALIDAGNDVEANFELSNLYWKRPALRPQLMSRLRQVSHRIYFEAGTHYMAAYEVQPGDVLQAVAKEYHVPWQYLAKLNRTKPERIRPGQKLKVIEGPFSAVVSLSEFKMTVHAHGHFVAEFPVGIGRDSSTPVGKFAVKEKLVDPTYYGPEGIIAHDDPKNPLGEYWLDLGDSYGIHGTTDPDSIGRAESKGCVRLRDADIAAVYDLLGVGSEVRIKK